MAVADHSEGETTAEGEIAGTQTVAVEENVVQQGAPEGAGVVGQALETKENEVVQAPEATTEDFVMPELPDNPDGAYWTLSDADKEKRLHWAAISALRESNGARMLIQDSEDKEQTLKFLIDNYENIWREILTTPGTQKLLCSDPKSHYFDPISTITKLERFKELSLLLNGHLKNKFLATRQRSDGLSIKTLQEFMTRCYFGTTYEQRRGRNKPTSVREGRQLRSRTINPDDDGGSQTGLSQYTVIGKAFRGS